MTPGDPPLPPYGTETLAELVPSAMAVLDGEGAQATDALGLRKRLGPARRVCIYLIDGLGADLLARHAKEAPTLSRLAALSSSSELRTCFPSTTVTSLASIATGLPAGRHGLVGFTIQWPPTGEIVNLVRFTRHGASSKGEITHVLPPEVVQPHTTLFESAAARGISVVSCTDAAFTDSGLTRATMRGARAAPWSDPAQVVDIAVDQASSLDPGLMYLYHPGLDHTGHAHGVGSDRWIAELRTVDALVERLIDSLPADTALLVTGDHGMLNLDDDAKVDFDDDEVLQDGVRALGGEPRMRHVYARKGAAASVLETWRDRFCDRAWVADRETAIREGWFGPVDAGVRPRIGDVVVAFADDCSGVVQTRVDKMASRLRGHHGSLTRAESVVPLLATRSARDS